MKKEKEERRFLHINYIICNNEMYFVSHDTKPAKFRVT